jgi:hypothetical protein
VFYSFIPIKNQPKEYDHFFSLILIGCWAPYLFMTCSLLSFFFIIEVITILFFYNLVTSKNWALAKTNKKIKKNQKHTNLVFFQYWVNFFGSVLIVFSIIGVYLIVGSLEFSLINYFYVSVISANKNHIINDLI